MIYLKIKLNKKNILYNNMELLYTVIMMCLLYNYNVKIIFELFLYYICFKYNMIIINKFINWYNYYNDFFICNVNFIILFLLKIILMKLCIFFYKSKKFENNYKIKKLNTKNDIDVFLSNLKL